MREGCGRVKGEGEEGRKREERMGKGEGTGMASVLRVCLHVSEVCI